jgi:KRAB domain-containing zinc finger protein
MKKEDDSSAVDTSGMNVAGSSYQDAIAGSVGVHLLAPLGLDRLSPDNKYTDTHSVTFSGSEQECSSCDHEKHFEDRQNPRLASDNEVQRCECIRDYKPDNFLGICRSKTRLKEKPYICAYCGQPFRYMSSLTRHLVIHSGEKRHVCQICNKAFTQEAHLKTHSILHTGEKPFHCNVCPMSFSRKGNLKRHLQIHKGSK